MTEAPAADRVTYLRTEMVPLADLTPFPGNARIHDLPKLVASVKRGQYKSLTVRLMDDGSMVILAGNGTFKALGEVGKTEARCELVECDDAEALSINIRDNPLGESGKYDEDLLAAQIRDVDADDRAVLGFDDGFMAKVLGEEPMPPPGDAPTDGDVGNNWGIIIECGTEDQQVDLLRELTDRGLAVRAIVG